jgi:hypothetical protein
MSFGKELRAIPRTAWIIAFACYAGFAILLHFAIHSDTGPHGVATWPLAGQLALNFLAPLTALVAVLLLGYIYGDAKRRGTRYGKELSVIPPTARIIALAVYIGLVILIHFLMSSDRGPQGMATWPLAGQLAFNFLIPVMPLIAILFYGYIYGDAKRRGMHYAIWTVLAIFVPYLIGVLLYFVLRDPIPSECPACHNFVLAKFTFCPHCGASVRPSCPQCGKSIEPGWVNCGYCGAKVPGAVTRVA